MASKPINSSAYNKNGEDDKGLWKVGEEYYPISEMSNDFLQTAFYHCLKKIGSHSQRIKKSMSSLEKFENKSKELYKEMKSRGIEDRVDDSPQEALQKALGEQINIPHDG